MSPNYRNISRRCLRELPLSCLLKISTLSLGLAPERESRYVEQLTLNVVSYKYNIMFVLYEYKIHMHECALKPSGLEA